MNTCISIKSKKENNIRCPRKAKPQCEFCGYHQKTKVLFKEVYKKLPPIDASDPYILKLTLDHHKLSYNAKNTPRSLYNQLNTHLDKLSKYEGKIIKIQSLFRKNREILKKETLNTEDFYTLDSLLTIPSIYFIKVNDNDKYYGFDIRSLKKYLEANKKNINNPFINIPFDHNSLKIIKDRISYLYKKKLFYKENNDILTKQQKYKQSVFEVFRLYDELGFITQLRWFFDLNFMQLKILYKKAEDIWNYRAQLSTDTKKNIVKDGKAFPVLVIKILKSNIYHIDNIRYTILREFKRLASEGVTESDKKTGAMLMLTALVEVSIDAANSYPWLVQV